VHSIWVGSYPYPKIIDKAEMFARGNTLAYFVGVIIINYKEKVLKE
jgi:hypothetical protein